MKDIERKRRQPTINKMDESCTAESGQIAHKKRLEDTGCKADGRKTCACACRVRNSCCRHSLYTLAGSCCGCIRQSHRTGDTPAETYSHKESISETLGLVICNMSTCIVIFRAQSVLPLPRFGRLKEYYGEKCRICWQTRACTWGGWEHTNQGKHTTVGGETDLFADVVNAQRGAVAFAAKLLFLSVLADARHGLTFLALGLGHLVLANGRLRAPARVVRQRRRCHHRARLRLGHAQHTHHAHANQRKTWKLVETARRRRRRWRRRWCRWQFLRRQRRQTWCLRQAHFSRLHWTSRVRHDLRYLLRAKFIGKAVFICLVGSVNLVMKFRGTCFSAGWTPKNYST